MQKSRKFIKFYILSLILFFILSCDDNPFFSFDNPLDPQSEAFAGIIVVSEPDLIKVVSPVNGQEMIFPHFVLTKCGNASAYKFQISTSESDFGSHIIWDSGVTSDFQSYPIFKGIQNTDYYWRGSARKEERTWGKYSDIGSFKLIDGISNISPTDGSTTMDTTPLINWDDVGGAVSYKIKTSNTKTGLAGAIEISVSASEYQYPSELTYDEEIWWQVTAVNDITEGVPSKEYRFVAPPPPIVTMIDVAGGTFTMGGEYPNEQPTHNVTISDFIIGETEVTYAKWKEVYDWAVNHDYRFANQGMAGNNDLPEDGLNEPVTNINWRDVIVWCNAASEYNKRFPVYTYNGTIIKDSFFTNANACDNTICDWNANGYRLPTEAEWEYAARGGNNDTNNGQYAGSSNIDEVAWYSGNSGNDTHDVKTKLPNELGIYDMSGNVSELCWDWYGKYTSDPVSDPTGPASGSSRLVKGGSWYTGGWVADRRGAAPDKKNNISGFRIAVSENIP